MLLPPTRDQAQPMTKMVQDWCEENNMIGGLRKMGVIEPDDIPPQNPILWHGVGIPIVTWYQYLGIPTGPDGIDHFRYVTDQVQAATKHLRILTGRGSHWQTDAKMVIARTFILPPAMYGAGLLGHLPAERKQEALTRLRPLHLATLRWIYNLKTLPKNTSVLEAQANIPAPETTLREWAT